MSELPPGAIGYPPGYPRQRVDFIADEFAALLEHGPRFVWERHIVCPCASLDPDATDLASPNCTTCGGLGRFWVGHPEYDITDASTAESIGELSLIQQEVQARNNGTVIRAYLAEGSAEQRVDELGPWGEGKMFLTTRPENRLAYYDRLVGIDTEVAFTDKGVMPAAGVVFTPRYPVLGVTLVVDENGVEYRCGHEYTLTDAGRLQFVDATVAPAAGVNLSLHVHVHPAWIVTKQPHAVRTSTRLFRIANPSSPSGEVQPLPLRAEVDYEWEREDLRLDGWVADN